MDSKHVEIGGIEYLFGGGDRDKYVKKVCSGRLPFMSVVGGEYVVDLGPLGVSFSDVGADLLRSYFPNGVVSKMGLVVGASDLGFVHRRFLGLLRNGDLFDDSVLRDKVKGSVSSGVLWSYWDMLCNYAEFRKDFRYYWEAYDVAKGLYARDYGSVLDVGMKDVTVVLDFFSSRFEKYGLDNDFPKDFVAPSGIELISVDLYDFVHDKFDLVFCQQVLEHLDDPVGAFRKLFELTGDVLVVSVPFGDWHESKWGFIDECVVGGWAGKRHDVSSVVEDFGVRRLVLGYKVGGGWCGK